MSNYRIFLSNDLSALVEGNERKFLNSSFFHNDFPLIVQNNNLAEWLKLTLCRTSGLSADFNFIYPEIAVRELIKGFESPHELYDGEEIPLLFMDELKVLVFKELQQILLNPDGFSEFLPILEYLQQSSARNSPIPDSLIYQVSDAIAGMFYHYIMNCPEIGSYWESGKLFPGFPARFRQHEEWQCILWRRLFHNSGFFHISRVINHIIEKNDSFTGDFNRVLLFGSSFMGDTSLRFFHYLSRFIEVDHFLLSPSPLLFNKDSTPENPILKKSAALITGFSRLSHHLGIDSINDLSIEYQESNTISYIKKGIKLNLSVCDSPYLPEKKDDSFQVLSCPGKLRETEIVRDKVLKMLDADDSLNLVDIGIMAPDINQYAPFIDAVFSSFQSNGKSLEDHLPVNIIDLSGGMESPFIEGLLSILELAGSRFSRSRIINLMRNPCFCEKNKISRNERERWEEILKELHVRWGMDREHRDSFVKNSDYRNSWEVAIKRLMKGTCLDEVDDEILPFTASGDGEIAAYSRFVRLIRSLYADCASLNRKQMSLKSWVYLCESLMESYLGCRSGDFDDERERLRVKSVFADLQNLESGLNYFAAYHDRKFSYSFFTTLFREALAKGGKRRGRYLTQGISCASIKPLRAMPFRVLIIMGLNESLFPAKENIASFDLRDLVDKSIDLSRENSDRYSFLEAILSAGDNLILSYSGIDPVDGSERYPSPVINEIFDFFDENTDFPDEMNASRFFTQQYSLQSWDSSCFKQDEKQSCSPLHFREYQTSLKSFQKKGNANLHQLPLSSLQKIKEEGITLDELIAYYKNPVKWYSRTALGIYLDDKDSSSDEIPNDPIDPEFLEQYSVFNHFSRHLPEIDSRELIEEEISIQKKRGILSESYLGRWTSEKWKQSMEEIFDFSRGWLKGKWELQESVHFELNLNQEQKIEFQGNSGEFYSNTDKHVLLVRYIASGSLKFKHLIEPYFKGLALKKLFPEKSVSFYFIGERFSGRGFAIDQSLKPLLLLEKAIKGLFAGIESPFPLYPDFMGEFDKGYFENEEGFFKAWKSDVNNSFDYGSHTARDCPYRSHFFPEYPQWNPVVFELLINGFYSPVRQSLQEIEVNH